MPVVYPSHGSLNWDTPLKAYIDGTDDIAVQDLTDYVDNQVAAEAVLARNADNLTSGTVDDALIPAGIARDSEIAADYVARGSQVLTPEDFGAVGDGITVTDASISNGSPTLGGTHTFVAEDAGKLIVILPAAGSSQPTFATTILSVAGGVATLNTNAPYTGSSLEATFATDDTTALTAWLADTRHLTRLLPGRTYGFTDSLLITDNYDVVCAQGAVLSVMAQIPSPSGWPAAARVVPTAVYSAHASLIQSKSWTGSTIDLNGLCTDGFAPKWVRQYTLRSVKVRGGASGGTAFIFGDNALTNTSYQVNVDNCLGWRDYGQVPRASNMGGVVLGAGLTVTAAADTITKTSHGLVDGQMFVVTAKTGSTGLLTNTNYYVTQATANTFKVATRAGVTQTVLDITTDGTADVTYYPLPLSVGLSFTESCTDSNVTGKTTMMGYQVGFENKAGNNRFGPSTHAWSRSAIGLMDYAFDDYNGYTYYDGTYADTPQIAGYRARSTTNPSFWTEPTAYMGSFGGIDNTAFGFILDGARIGHTFVAPKIIGSTSSLRFKAAVATATGSIVTPSYPWVDSYENNVTNTTGDTPTPEKTNGQTSTSSTLFTANHGQLVTLNNASPITFTINTGVFGAGNWCDIVQTGAGQVTIAAGAGVTLRSDVGLKTAGQYSVLHILRDSASETFYISGDGDSTHSVPKSLIDAKGDLITGTADDTAARKAVGSDGAQLVADSTQSDGLRWTTTSMLEGSGDPEGVVTATIGSAYRDTTNGWLYEKQTGSGNTGWVGVGIPVPRIAPASGSYLFPQGPTSTSSTLGNTTLNVTPWFCQQTFNIVRIGGEITSAGESGSKLRLGIYADSGAGKPGALILDVGQIAGDSATVQEITLGSTLVLPRGWYWLGGAVQSAPTTQPTVRITSATATFPSQLGFLIVDGTSLPTANRSPVGYNQGSVSGSLPSPFTSSPTPTGTFSPRMFFKLA